MPRANFDELLGFVFEIPDKDEQCNCVRRIRTNLDAVGIAVSATRDQLRDASLLTRASLSEQFQDTVPVRTSNRGKVLAGWQPYRLTDLARLESGHTPSRRRPEWWGGDVPWLALPDIRKLHGKHAYTTTENTNDAGLANSSARRLPVGTVCLCRDASVGYVTILGKPMATSQHFCNWICDPDQLDAEFLMYSFMASHDYLRELSSGSVIKTIYMPTIKSFHICAPGVDEQRRIARTLRARLAAAEALSVGLKARLAEIERLPQRLLATAFGQA